MENGKYLSKEQLFEIITNYIYLQRGILFDVVPILKVKETSLGKVPDLKLYLETTIDDEKIRIPLTEKDIKDIITAYVTTPKVTLNTFQYIGGVHRTGLYIDEDIPHFEGVMIYLKPNEKPFVKTKNGK